MFSLLASIGGCASAASSSHSCVTRPRTVAPHDLARSHAASRATAISATNHRAVSSHACMSRQRRADLFYCFTAGASPLGAEMSFGLPL